MSSIERLKQLREKLNAIPARKWCTNKYFETSLLFGTRHCARGHLGIRYNTSDGEVIVRNRQAIDDDLFLKNLFHKENTSIASINNGDDIHYQQSGPKERVIAALDDQIAKLMSKVQIEELLAETHLNSLDLKTLELVPNE